MFLCVGYCFHVEFPWFGKLFSYVIDQNTISRSEYFLKEFYKMDVFNSDVQKKHLRKKRACFRWMWPCIRRHFLFADNEKSSFYSNAKDQIVLN